MSYSTKVGSFNIDTTKTVGQTQAITGVGFEPKVVLFWWSGSTGTSDTVAGGNINIGFGAAISSTSRFAVNGISGDALADSNTLNSAYNTECIRCYADADTLDGIMDFSSMDAGGFTLIVDDQFSNAYRISYLALGGTDLTNVYIGNKAMPLVTGNFDTTGIGFKPDAVIIASAVMTSAANATAPLFEIIGMATGSSNQGVLNSYSKDAAATTITTGYGYNGEVYGSTSYRGSFVEFINDGFTINHLEGASARYFHYVALKGGKYKVHELTTRTDSNDIVENDVGFSPVALFFLSANRALSTQDAVTSHNRISIGAATSATNRACAAISDENNLADTEAAYANYDSAVYAHVIDDAIAGLMDVKSIDSNGFTCVMDDADPSGCWVSYLAIGSSETEPTTITATVTVVDWCEP